MQSQGPLLMFGEKQKIANEIKVQMIFFIPWRLVSSYFTEQAIFTRAHNKLGVLGPVYTDTVKS